MQLPSRCNRRTGRYGPGNKPVSCTAYRAKNAKLANFEAVENNVTAFARKQCLHQKVAVCMENPKMQPPSRCNKRTGRYGSGKARFHAPRIIPSIEIWQTSKLLKTMAPLFHKAMFISKGSCGYGEPKYSIAFSVQ